VQKSFKSRNTAGVNPFVFEYDQTAQHGQNNEIRFLRFDDPPGITEGQCEKQTIDWVSEPFPVPKATPPVATEVIDDEQRALDKQ
jgi:hypothetical protein